MSPMPACSSPPTRPVTSPQSPCRSTPEAPNARSKRMTDRDKYGPWAVIAGGSEGVGAEFARMLAEDGFNLVLIARKPGPLEETALRCRELGVEVRALSLDLLDPESVLRIAEHTSDVEVGLLIYNAGASTCNEPFLEAGMAQFQKVIDLNMSRMLDLVQHFGRPMVGR